MVLLLLIGLSSTTIIASAFTTLPAAFHFNRFAAWSLPANAAGHADRHLSGDAGRCGECLPDAFRAGILAFAGDGVGA